MNIRNWPIGQILQLPDNLLSRRYVVFVALDMLADTTRWDISELALPNQAIIHELSIIGIGAYGNYCYVRLALGDQLPVNVATMSALEPLFMGLGYQGPDPREFSMATGGSFHLNRLRMYVPAQGRRLVMECRTPSGKALGVLASIVCSSVPTEVPDCLLSL